jgi:chemotaxis protein CheC
MSPLSQGQQDALKELGNIGAGHAANSLAALLGRPISLEVPSIDAPPLSSLFKMDLERVVVAIDMGIHGDVKGHILVVFDRADALDLATAFVRKMVRIENPTDSDIDSTFQEFANIIAGSYLAALCQMTGLQLALTTPTVVAGTMKVVISHFPSLENDRNIILIESRFTTENRLIPGQIILVPEENSLSAFLAPLEAKAHVSL